MVKVPVIIPERFVVGGGVEGLSDRSRRLFGLLAPRSWGPRLLKVSLLCMSRKSAACPGKTIWSRFRNAQETALLPHLP